MGLPRFLAEFFLVGRMMIAVRIMMVDFGYGFRRSAVAFAFLLVVPVI